MIFYRDLPEPNVAEIVGVGGLSGTAGRYMINIFNNGELEIVPGQTYYVAIPQDDDGYGADPQEVRITGQGFEVVDLTLTAGGGITMLSGTVTNLADLTVFPAATITIAGAGSGANSGPSTSGRYAITNPPTGAQVVNCEAAGYDARAFNVDIIPGTTTIQDFALVRGSIEGYGSVIGTVTDNRPSPWPIEGAEVRIGGRSTRTDHQGRYTLTGIEAGLQTIYCNLAGFDPGEVGVTIPNRGTVVQDITLNATVALDTVPLNIERFDTDDPDVAEDAIRITWDPSLYPNPQIFVRTGDGTGQFSNDNADSGWKLYTDPAFAGQFDAVGLGTGTLIHLEQMGAGSLNREVYYKAITSTADPTTILPTALAVGKFDIQLYAGLSNMSAIPLIPNDPAINSVIGNQLPNGTDLSARRPTGEWDEVRYNSGWSTDIVLNPDYGFWVKIPSGSPVLTLVGSVFSGTQRTITLYSGLNNLLGSVYPVRVNLNDSLLGTALGSNGGELAAFAQGIWFEPRYTGTTWTDLSYQLTPGKGFWVRRNQTGTNPWNYPRRY